MNISKRQQKRDRRKKRFNQIKINQQLKKRLFGHLSIAPCYYCKSIFLYINLTIEHLKPLAFGGTNEDSNIALACLPCNRRKGKEALALKRCKDKNEQYSSQHSRENRTGSVQGTEPSHLHCQRDGV
jgi:5-methylcytosine-specific restriction endonuclease McrA